ncbi:MAG: DUF3810 family protein [Candidatus Eremiobacteraeota bacterium]|nr:DUF3810 family protein [Candidatus Eremiobacteraeota bacterium]
MPIQQTLKSVLKCAAIAVGAVALYWQPDSSWIERAYVNGAYSHWELVASAITRPFPWSLGDVAALVGIAAIVWRVVVFARRPQRRIAHAVQLALTCAAIAGVYAAWFELSWGWNYARAPVEARVRFDPARVTPASAVALRGRAMAEMNELAATAHARAAEPLDLSALYAAWLPAVQRAGDDWMPAVGAAKPTISDPFMLATGTSGFINPLTLNVALASDLLWFERPFDLAHEWSHDAAYAREDEANYLAILTCMRSADPAIQYSGWFELFLYLPQKARYAHREFVPLIWQDFAAIRKRDARHINVMLAHWSWRTYNAYLKSNRISSGIANYDEVTRLMLGAPLDASGLPIAR